jgi:hypothetical protein
MSRTIHKRQIEKAVQWGRPSTGRARGISGLKQLYRRICRRMQDAQMRTEDPVIDESKRLKNFWWEYF